MVWRRGGVAVWVVWRRGCVGVRVRRKGGSVPECGTAQSVQAGRGSLGWGPRRRARGEAQRDTRRETAKRRPSYMRGQWRRIVIYPQRWIINGEVKTYMNHYALIARLELCYREKLMITLRRFLLSFFYHGPHKKAKARKIRTNELARSHPGIEFRG